MTTLTHVAIGVPQKQHSGSFFVATAASDIGYRPLLQCDGPRRMTGYVHQHNFVDATIIVVVVVVDSGSLQIKILPGMIGRT